MVVSKIQKWWSANHFRLQSISKTETVTNQLCSLLMRCVRTGCARG